MQRKVVNVEKVRICAGFGCENRAAFVVVYDDYNVLFVCRKHERAQHHHMHTDAASAAVKAADTTPTLDTVKPVGSQAAPVM